MSKVRAVRALVEQRLTAAAEEIFGLFERTIAEYEEELCRSKEENERQQKLLDAVFNPQLQLHRADVQQLLVFKEEVPLKQQDSSLHQDQDQEDPEPPHIKEEQEELWSSQEGEQQLQGLEEADITKSTFTPVPVKSEDDEEKPQSSQLHQTQTEHMETEAAGEDCGGPGPDRDSDPDPHLQPVSEDSSEPSDPGLRGDRVSASGKRRGPVKKPSSCSECGKTFQSMSSLIIHMRIHTGEKPYSCSVCDRRFNQKPHLKRHLMCHTAKGAFSCPVCDKRFKSSIEMNRHMAAHDTPATHTGKPDADDETAELSAAQTEVKSSSNSPKKKRVWTCSASEKPFGCSECREMFSSSTRLKVHMRVHTREKPLSCPVCGNRFSRRGNLLRHMSRHAGVKPYSCPVCMKCFKSRKYLKCHERLHTVAELSASCDSDKNKTETQKHQQHI